MGMLPRSWLTWRVGVVAAATFLVLCFFGFPRNSLPRTFTPSWPTTRTPILLEDDISWSDFAYCTYATSASDLCNSVMLLAALHKVRAKADRLLLYSSEWDVNDAESSTGALLRRARDAYGAHIKPIKILRADAVSDPTWAAGFTKWLAFDQTQYRRILTLDSDATILKDMDELFLLPRTPVGLPRAYWLNDTLSAQVALVQPSSGAFARVRQQIADRSKDDFDMEIINALYGDSCMIMPHRPYNLLTGEFRAPKHGRYLGDRDEVWDPDAVMREVKYIHFSDWPLPKPWVSHSQAQFRELWPKCNGVLEGEVEDCPDRKIWAWLYDDFRERRKEVCGEEFVSWTPMK
nr:glucose n-acetyltransferase 1 [Quercus suber]